jgi:dTDP-4-amino-4,6-dideoxygalactose transaminase
MTVDKKQIDLVQPTLVPWVEVEPLFAEVWRSGRLTIGPHTEKFERAMAEFLGVRYAVAVNSCTSGLMLALRALGLDAGEVIIPSFTWTSTGLALAWNGLTPVFADIAPGVCTLDPADVRRRLTPATRAIIAVNAFGIYPDMDALQAVADEAGAILLCDSAQAIGAVCNGRRGGGLCRAEIFSFSPTKVVTAIEAGLVATDDEPLARRVRQMRDYGKSVDASDIEHLGLSARISEFHAIVGLANLRRVDALIAARAELAAAYRRGLADIEGLAFQTIPEGWKSSWNYFVVFFDPARYDRDAIWRRMAAAHVYTKRYFYPALHRQTVYRHLPPPSPPLTVTERTAATALALPFYSHMHADDVAEVCVRLKQALH